MGINFKAMRHRSPLASIRKFLSCSETLLLIASDASVDIKIVDSQSAVLRQLLNHKIIGRNLSVRFKTLGSGLGSCEMVFTIESLPPFY